MELVEGGRLVEGGSTCVDDAEVEAAAAAIRECADAAGRLLFPGSPIDFPLDLEITERSAKK